MAPKTPRQQQLDEVFEHAVREEADQRVAAAVQEAVAAAVQEAVAAAQRRAAEAEAAAQLRIVQVTENLQNIRHVLQTQAQALAQALAQAQAQVTEAHQNLANILMQFTAAGLPPAGGLPLPVSATGVLPPPVPPAGVLPLPVPPAGVLPLPVSATGGGVVSKSTKRSADPNMSGPSKKKLTQDDGSVRSTLPIANLPPPQQPGTGAASVRRILPTANPPPPQQPGTGAASESKQAPNKLRELRKKLTLLETAHGNLKDIDKRTKIGRDYKKASEDFNLLRETQSNEDDDEEEEAEEEEAEEEEAEEAEEAEDEE